MQTMPNASRRVVMYRESNCGLSKWDLVYELKVMTRLFCFEPFRIDDWFDRGKRYGCLKRVRKSFAHG